MLGLRHKQGFHGSERVGRINAETALPSGRGRARHDLPGLVADYRASGSRRSSSVRPDYQQTTCAVVYSRCPGGRGDDN